MTPDYFVELFELAKDDIKKKIFAMSLRIK